MVFFHHSDGKPGQVHLSNTQLAGVFGQLATEDGAPCLPAAVGDAGHDGGDGVRVKLPPQLVVEEEERLGTLAHEVVYAHGHQVDADGLQPPGLDGYGQLGADAVSRGHQHGARYPDGISNSPPKLPRPPITSGRAVLATRGPMSDTARSPASMSTPAVA